MALIGEIQKRIWIVFVFIGIALVGFLIMDSTQSSQGTLGGGSRTEFASIGDQEINPNDYQQAVAKAQNEYLVRQQRVVDAVQGNFRFDDATTFNLEEQAWNQLVNDKLINQRLKKAPMSVTDDEFANLVYGDQPHPFIQQMKQVFPSMGLDPNQPGAMQQFVQFTSNQEQYQQFPALQQYYMDFRMREQAAREDRLQNKYTDFLKKSSYTPAWVANRDHQMQNSRLNLDYVMLAYRDIADDEVSVTDLEVEAHYNKMLPTFTEQEKTANVEYVAFDVVATGGDSIAIMDKLMEYQGNWAQEDNDSIFLSLRSQDQYAYTGAWMTQANLYQIMVDSTRAKTAFTTAVDEFTQSYLEGGSYKITKMLARRAYPDSVHLRHVFLRFNTPEDSITKRGTIDSLFAVLQSGASTFEDLAARFSEDESNAQNGGDLEWINPNTPFFPVLRNYIYNTGTLNRAQVVKSPIGYHIMEILEKRNTQPHVKIGILALPIRPSRETDDVAYRQAETFYEQFGRNEEGLFDQGVSESGYQKRIAGTFRENQYTVTGLPQSRSVVNWAFQTAELGDVRLFTLPDKHVVVRVREKAEAGPPDLENVRTQVESDLINERKAAQLMAKANEAMSSASDLETIASNLGQTVGNASGATFGSNFIPQVGAEPDVLGHVFGMELNTTSKPLRGKQGVFIVRPTAITPADALPDYTAVRTRLSNQEKSKMSLQSVLGSLKKDATIVDNHRNF